MNLNPLATAALLMIGLSQVSQGQSFLVRVDAVTRRWRFAALSVAGAVQQSVRQHDGRRD